GGGWRARMPFGARRTPPPRPGGDDTGGAPAWTGAGPDTGDARGGRPGRPGERGADPDNEYF
ncbi:hypothetical protein AB0N23_24675, partial [Streptomyces sp. NPDC052644]